MTPEDNNLTDLDFAQAHEHLTPGTPIRIDNVAGSVQSLPLIRGSWYER